MDATESFTSPVDFDLLVMVSEELDKVIGMFFANVFDAKIIDDKAEGDRSPLMVP